jgi:hypothetical protein
MFRWITGGSGAVKEYFFVKQDPAYRPVASKRQRMILFDKKTPLDRTSFNGLINGTLFW